LASADLEPSMTPLDKPLRRALDIDGKPYTVTVAPDGLKLVEKGRRKGIELRWSELVGGDAALAAALQASLAPDRSHR
jgi:hypothetical protein